MTRIYAWNPRRPVIPGRFAQYTRFGPRLSNFGDLLGPLVVQLMLDRLGVRSATPAGDPRTLFSIGSVIHEARDSDVVWGSGMNGKKAADQHRFRTLDVRAVRGPLTADFLEKKGIDVPPVYGDPALLLPTLLPQMTAWAQDKKRRTGVVPNFNERRQFNAVAGFIDPLGDPLTVIKEIAQSERIVGSSLHGVIVAEALGIPAVAFASGVERPFKYMDYFAGSGRDDRDYVIADDLTGALRLVESPAPRLDWDSTALMQAFPVDLWPESPPHRKG